MSRSQFSCIMVILRHAWLNLRDERMTTGRINQVAIRTQAFRLPLVTDIERISRNFGQDCVSPSFGSSREPGIYSACYCYYAVNHAVTGELPVRKFPLSSFIPSILAL